MTVAGKSLSLALHFAAKSALAAVIGIVSLSIQPPQARAGDKTGVLLELFTSQGCYSCPPADALLGELIKRPGVVAVTLNVDYWDKLGWKDPLASPAYTKRQYGYVNAHHERSPYTPHLVVDGAVSLVGSDKPSIEKAIAAAAKKAPADLKLSHSGSTLNVVVSKGEAGGDLYVMAAPYRSEVVQEILSGENGGKTLTYHHVALEVRQIGVFKGDEVSLSVALPKQADGVAVWLQKATRYGAFGPVVAVGKLDL